AAPCLPSRAEHRHDAGNAHFIEALHPVEILAVCERGDFDLATGVPRHLAEFRQHLADIATWNPTIAIAEDAPCAMRESAADVDRRMRFLDRFGPRDHRIEMDEFAVIFRSLLGPDFLHRLDRFAHPLEAGRIDGAVVFHFVLVPATPDSKQEPSLARLVD